MKTLPFGQKVFERVIVQGLSLIGLMGVNIIVARTLGAEGKGALSLAMLVPNVLYVLSNLGYFLSNSYFLGRKKESIHKLVSNALVFSIVVSVIASILFLLFFPLFQEQFFSGVEPRLLFVALIGLPFLQMINIFNGILLVRDRVRFFNAVSVGKIILHLILTFSLLILLQYGVYAALYSWILAQIFSAIVTFIEVSRSEKIIFKIDLPLMWRTITYGLRGYVGNFINFMAKKIDIIMISFFLVLSDVGVYSITLALGEAFIQLPVAVTTLLFPRVASSTDKASNEFTPKIFRNMLYIMTLAALVAIVIAKPVVLWFFGEEFAGAIVPFYISLPSAIFIGLMAILTNDLAGRGRLGIQSMIATLAFILNIIFNILFIPSMGLNGAALSSTATFFIVVIVTMLVYRKITKVHLRELIVLRKSDMQYYFEITRKILKRS